MPEILNMTLLKYILLFYKILFYCQVPLGVIDKDEARIADMVDIMSHFQQYVPRTREGDPITTILFGDGLSCERANDASLATANGENAWSRLEGLQPAVQEWHKRVLLLQDIFGQLFNDRSSRDRGTLFQLKNIFNQRNVSSEVKNCFNEAEDFLNFVTTGYVLAAALPIWQCSWDSISFPSETEAKLDLIKTTASQIVDLVFKQSPTDSVLSTHVTADDEDYVFCVCHEDVGGPMILCDNTACPRGKWFHFACVSIDDDNIPQGKWYCHNQCKICAELSAKQIREIPKVQEIQGISWTLSG